MHAKGIAVLLLWLLCGSVQASDAPLLLDYQREFSMIEDADNSVDVRIYSDGMVEVHYPIFMRLAGDYHYQLDSHELENVLKRLRQLGLDTFDAPAAKRDLALAQSAALDSAQSGNGSVTIITDPDISWLSVAPSLVASDDAAKHVYSFAGVKNQALIYPQLTAVRNLASALDVLDQLAADSRMERIGSAQ